MWKRAVLDWRRTNPLAQLGKQHFAPILDNAIKTLKTSTIANGFKACGLYPWNCEAIDFSKCLGKNEKREVPTITDAENTSVLKYIRFCDIIGPAKLSELKHFVESECDDNFRLLKNIYNHFVTKENSNGSDLDESLITVENMSEDIPNFSQHTINNYSVTEEIIVEEEPTSSHNPDFDIENMPVILLDEQASIIVKKTKVTSEKLPEREKSNTPTDSESFEINQITPTHSPLLGNRANCFDTNQPSTSELSCCLQWPKTPERKGKRQTERLPFVITSSGFKKILEDKEKGKQDKENAKLEREKKRQEKRIIKTKPTHVRNIASLEADNSTTSKIGSKILPKNNIVLNKGLCFYVPAVFL